MSFDAHAAAAPQPVYPRGYLIGIYAGALEHGHIILAPFPEQHVSSFKASFYRLRRRSDTTNKSFITAEHHLVSVGNWRPGEAGTGELPIYYSSTEEALPSWRPASPSERVEHFSPDVHHTLPAQAPIASPEVQAVNDLADKPLAPEQIDDFVARMMAAANERDSDD